MSKVNADIFVDVARRRHAAYEAAVAYLENSGQSMYVAELPGPDIRLMKEMADRMAEIPVIRSMKEQPSGRSKRGRTVSLSDDYTRDIKLAVKSTVAAMTMDREL